MLNTYQDMFSSHYFDVPINYTIKMRINYIDEMNQKKFVPPPKLEEIKTTALKAGFDKKVTFPDGGVSGVTKFYKYESYGADTPAWRHERDCLNSGGILPQIDDLSEMELLIEVMK